MYLKLLHETCCKVFTYHNSNKNILYDYRSSTILYGPETYRDHVKLNVLHVILEKSII